MRKKNNPIFYVSIVGALILSACNMPGAALPTETAQPTSTIDIAATAAFADTQTKQAEPTETPTATATETPLPEPSATATPEVITARLGRESNCRVGPAGNYTLVATYQEGQILEVVANDLGAGYSFVRNPENPEEQCYLLTNSLTISGDTSVLPKFTPLPSPTAAPYFNVSFKKMETCQGEDYAIFDVENAGSVAFSSFYIKVTDQKADRSVEHVVNAFDQWTGCIIARDISPLGRGETGFVHSPHFKWKVNEDNLRAVIMLCTEKNLVGTCVTQVIDVKK
jgi:hypothetical protein